MGCGDACPGSGGLGDPEPMREFVAEQLGDDAGEPVGPRDWDAGHIAILRAVADALASWADWASDWVEAKSQRSRADPSPGRARGRNPGARPCAQDVAWASRANPGRRRGPPGRPGELLQRPLAVHAARGRPTPGRLLPRSGRV